MAYSPRLRRASRRIQRRGRALLDSGQNFIGEPGYIRVKSVGTAVRMPQVIDQIRGSKRRNARRELGHSRIRHQAHLRLQQPIGFKGGLHPMALFAQRLFCRTKNTN
jgi:hypothetical protein